MKRFLIFVLVGPELGLAGYALATALSGTPVHHSLALFFRGGLLLAPFVYLFGTIPALITFTLDEALVQANFGLVWRIIFCAAFGALLSFGLFHAGSVPVLDFPVKGLLAVLPGAIAGFGCSYLSGVKNKRRPGSRGVGWSAAGRD